MDINIVKWIADYYLDWIPYFRFVEEPSASFQTNTCRCFYIYILNYLWVVLKSTTAPTKTNKNIGKLRRLYNVYLKEFFSFKILVYFIFTLAGRISVFKPRLVKSCPRGLLLCVP